MQWGIRKKLIILLLVATVLPFGTSIAVTYYQTTQALNDRFVSTNHDLIEKGEEDLAAYFDEVADMGTVLYRYTPFMNVMRGGVSADFNNNQEEVRRLLAYLFNTRPEIEQMHLYIDKEKDSYTNFHSSISGRGKYENIFSHPYYAELKKSSTFSIIEPPHKIYPYNHLSDIPDSEKKKVLSFHNMIRDVPSDKFLGFLSIDINLSKISSLSNRLYTKGVEDLYIMDDQGNIVYSSNEHLIGNKNKDRWFVQVKKSRKGSKSLEWQDKKFSGEIVYERFSAPYKNWYIIKRIPYDVLYKSARETALMNIFIGIITLLIVLLATFFVSFKLTAPIKVLSNNMKKVENGELEADFDSLGNDEIGMLGRNFKSMITKINQLIDREYKLEIENKSSQLRVLRSQINPHFLYNALQSIGTLALKSNAAPVYSLLTSLSNIMRYSMNMNEDVVPLNLELRHVKSYLVLQKQRFEDKFEYELQVEKEVDQIMVPKMILQPIVENSFKHGFDQQIEEAFITIKGHAIDEETIKLSVSDNGRGIDTQQLKDLKRALFEENPSEEERSDAIGLKNIYDRLQIYYSNQAKMSVESGDAGSFIVTIEIPRVMPKEVKQS
ncbi:two-component system, sensor histidine kinase YesM [Fictibacillus solisalsi]|uniref:Two-component system, sensor histidine kinase YesM n=1 Tax=Fictibacillus solisalsi TaxID=459525 RepID=A0A1G9X960_9BACL|nr:sensor histidine kinase [Fictibacillus solisalsi]SDM92853.1 two-component system, sensor histidine kinase YesM [Fictibacillus solisalsi]